MKIRIVIQKKSAEIIKLLAESNLNYDFINKINNILKSIVTELDIDEKLTGKEKETIDFVNVFIDNYGESPSYEEVAKGIGISKTAAYARLRNYRHKMKAKLNVSGG